MNLKWTVRDLIDELEDKIDMGLINDTDCIVTNHNDHKGYIIEVAKYDDDHVELKEVYYSE